MRPRRAGLAALAFLFAMSGAAACRPSREAASGGDAHPLPRPLVVVGVDGLEWRLVLDLAAKGRLPNLRKMMDDGVSARLSTLEPALSPPIWTSMATGVPPDVHGIRAFVQPGLRDAGGRPLLYTNRERRVKALWNIAGDAGIPSCVVGYWMTFPVEELRGVMVAQTGAAPGSDDEAAPGDEAPHRKGSLQEGRSGQVHPPELEARVFDLARRSRTAAAARERDLFGDTSAWPAPMKRLVEHSRWSLAADTAYQSVALDLLGEPGRCGLAVVYLGLPDVLGHRFWRWAYPGDFSPAPSTDETAAFGDVLAHAYEQVDAFVGEVRRKAGPGATVIVASDHGMGAFRPKARVDLEDDDGPLLRNGGHSAARQAFFVGAGPGLRREANTATDAGGVPSRGSILDFTPTMLALLGLPRGADMTGHAIGGVLAPAFLAAHPQGEIPTHTPADWGATRRLADAAAAPPADRIEQLRGLGYLE